MMPEADLVAARAALDTAAQMKLTVLGNLVTAMKKDIKYAETTVGNDNAKLTLIGWGARKEPAPIPAPGQTLELSATVQGEGSVSFSWKKPADGGGCFGLHCSAQAKTRWTVVGCGNFSYNRDDTDESGKKDRMGIQGSCRQQER